MRNVCIGMQVDSFRAEPQKGHPSLIVVPTCELRGGVNNLAASDPACLGTDNPARPVEKGI
jgi:hypothetical protein